MTKQDGPAKRVGRPPKGVGKRQNYTFRMNEGVRDQLVAAAERDGRSLSEEIERRVAESTAGFDFLLEHFGRSETVNLMLLLSTAVRLCETRTGKAWPEDLQTQRIMSQAIMNLGQVCGPVGDRMSDDTARIVAMEAAVVSQAALQLLNPQLNSELNSTGEWDQSDPRRPDEFKD